MAHYDLTSPIERRVRFFDGQFLQDQDFIDEQLYHLDRERRHNRLLHVAGIAEGLQVQAAGAYKLAVTAGTAVDADGRPLVLVDQAQVDLAPETFTNQRGARVLAAYQEVAADQQAVGGSADETRWLEHPRIVALPATAPWDGATPPVTLAAINVDDKGNITVDPSVRRYSGVRLPGAAADSPGLAATAAGPVELTGSLTVDGNLGVGTGLAAATPATRLDVAGVADRQQISLQLRGGNSAGGTASAQLTFGWNNSAQYRHAITTRHHGDQQLGNAIDFYVWRYDTKAGAADKVGDLHSLTLDSGSVGIGTTTPGQKLEVRGGKIQLDGDQQLLFRDGDTTNNLKLQLWSGYGLGINGGTLFYAANGRHSWRDNSGTNERMALTTAANGGLTVSGTGQSSFAGPLQLRREATATAGGKQLFLELYQDDPQNNVPEVYPSIRLHHNNKFWHRIEGRSDGIYFKNGNLAGDGAIDIHANAAVLAALQIGNVRIGENELRILQKLAAGQLQFDLYNVKQDEYAYAADYNPYDNDRRYVWTWRPKGRVNQGRWRLDYPG